MVELDLQLLGNVLGMSTLVGCLVAQLPQIAAMIKSKNVDGISFNAFAIETYSITIQVLYFVAQEYDFLAYGDIAVLLLQDFVIIGLILAYGKEPLTYQQYGHLAGYFGAVGAVVFGTISKDVIINVMQAVVFLNIASKITFVASIFGTKDTSAMEPAGWIIFVYSNCVRIFSAYVLLGDLTLTAQNCINLAFNGFILFLVLKYRGGNKQVEEEKKKE